MPKADNLNKIGSGAVQGSVPSAVGRHLGRTPWKSEEHARRVYGYMSVITLRATMIGRGLNPKGLSRKGVIDALIKDDAKNGLIPK